MTPKELKLWRKKNGYSQGKLANILGVIPLTVSRWERGVREIPSFLHLTLECLEKKGGERKMLEGKQKEFSDAEIKKILTREFSDAEIKKILTRQFQAIGMKEADITQELIDMKRDELKARTILRAYNAFKKGMKKEKERKVRKRGSQDKGASQRL